MAKSFFYVSLALLCFAAAYQLGAERAAADWTPRVSGQIVGGDVFTRNSGSLWFSRSGEAWRLRSNGWLRMPSQDLPEGLIHEVKFLLGDDSEIHLITTSDVGFVWSPEGWFEVGPLPQPES
jgi:hypothetical protein